MEERLEEELSRPTDADRDAVAGLHGRLLILGVSGKMGPSLARLVRRAADDAGTTLTVSGVARFADEGPRRYLEAVGVETIGADLLDPQAVAGLPDADHVIYMVGQKFGTTHDPATTWAINTVAPTLVLRRFPGVPTVLFSTGNVYPFVATNGPGSAESDPVGPVGEYAQSALGRERIAEFMAATLHTPMVILRLSYAAEPRYGILRDLADQINSGRPIDLSCPTVNVIWQRDANSTALRALLHATVPPAVLNVTGPAVSVRRLAESFADRLGVEPTFTGQAQETALLSNAGRAMQLFGAPSTDLETMLDEVARWVAGGGRSLGKPTHFQERSGAF